MGERHACPLGPVILRYPIVTTNFVTFGKALATVVEPIAR